MELERIVEQALASRPSRLQRQLVILIRAIELRRGFWGLRTLALMGYYARPAAAASVGYHADPRGWEARR